MRKLYLVRAWEEFPSSYLFPFFPSTKMYDDPHFNWIDISAGDDGRYKKLLSKFYNGCMIHVAGLKEAICMHFYKRWNALKKSCWASENSWEGSTCGRLGRVTAWIFAKIFFRARGKWIKWYINTARIFRAGYYPVRTLPECEMFTCT